MSFAFGAHYCLGASLARLEATEMIAAMQRWWRAVRPSGPPAPWSQRGPFRGQDELVVAVEAH